jgi:hypothetical protein
MDSPLKVKNKMEQTSLEQFNKVVESVYPSLKEYIVSSDEKKIYLEDSKHYAWGKNPDLAPLFENPAVLPIKNMDVIYKERDSMFLITIHLK